MKQLVIVCIFWVSGYALGQRSVGLKRKFFGSYQGKIESFRFNSGQELVNVDSSNIQINIADSTLEIVVGKNLLKGKYAVTFEAKTYYLIDCKMNEQIAGERIVVYKKGDKIFREGLYPQPGAMLYRSKD